MSTTGGPLYVKDVPPGDRAFVMGPGLLNEQTRILSLVALKGRSISMAESILAGDPTMHDHPCFEMVR